RLYPGPEHRRGAAGSETAAPRHRAGPIEAAGPPPAARLPRTKRGRQLALANRAPITRLLHVDAHRSMRRLRRLCPDRLRHPLRQYYYHPLRRATAAGAPRHPAGAHAAVAGAVVARSVPLPSR
nr:hypothetical protein [Tanacetum cinerariifolium]